QVWVRGVVAQRIGPGLCAVEPPDEAAAIQVDPVDGALLRRIHLEAIDEVALAPYEHSLHPHPFVRRCLPLDRAARHGMIAVRPQGLKPAGRRRLGLPVEPTAGLSPTLS